MVFFCFPQMKPFLPAASCIWVGVALCLATPTLAFSHGAGHASCQGMRPGHIRAQPQEQQHSHVILRTSASYYLPGQLVTGTILLLLQHTHVTGARPATGTILLLLQRTHVRGARPASYRYYITITIKYSCERGQAS